MTFLDLISNAEQNTLPWFLFTQRGRQITSSCSRQYFIHFNLCKKKRTSGCKAWNEELQSVTVLRNTIDSSPCSHKIRHRTRDLKETNNKSHYTTSIQDLLWVFAFIVTWRLCPKFVNETNIWPHINTWLFLFRQNHNIRNTHETKQFHVSVNILHEEAFTEVRRSKIRAKLSSNSLHLNMSAEAA